MSYNGIGAAEAAKTIRKENVEAINEIFNLYFLIISPNCDIS
jgi:hypothetical protein